ncbi:MAG: N-formylglutamate amidohydrolase [Rhodospirillaceae bacterium]|nr:N-formylglutamate amidohydrolase [Rhodospirillaceae bacterium]
MNKRPKGQSTRPHSTIVPNGKQDFTVVDRIQGTLVRIDYPVDQTAPLVVASPHSGRVYSAEFLEQSRLDHMRLRSSEDSFVEEIFGTAPLLGAPLVQALFPRVYIDVNREAYELDPDMFSDDLPEHAVTRNSRIAAGLGTIAKVVSNAETVYREKLTFDEAEQRIFRHYRPYHKALSALLDETRDKFGYCILLDCHSMPSGAAIHGRKQQNQGTDNDIVLGDCHGTSCGALVIAEAERALRAMGYTVRRNKPYAGGFVTQHYGRPLNGIHALQIELNRNLYMDEARLSRTQQIECVIGHMAELIQTLGNLDNPNVAIGEAAE